MTAILMVEDDAPMAGLYGRALAGQGHHVMIATGNQKAIEILQSSHIDLIILDMTLPDGPGTQLLDFLEAHPNLQQAIPVIITTGFVRYLKQGERNPVVETLTKPVTPSQLIQSVSAALDNLREG
ncbi:MAG: response regulator [Chloroflexi bacterium]|nr:response regulator [Chloroflexota bacterium]